MTKTYKAIFTETKTYEFTFEVVEGEDIDEKADETFEDDRDNVEYTFDETLKICGEVLE